MTEAPKRLGPEEEAEVLKAWPDAVLVDMIVAAKGNVRSLTEWLQMAETDAFHRMERSGGTQLLGTSHAVTLVRETAYDQGRLTPLLELLPAEELERCYTGPRTLAVDYPAKWDMTRTKAAARRVGTAALDVIEAAASPGAGRLKVEKR